MEINLAPWRYRNILKEDGGPIERLSLRKTNSPFPQRAFEAFAYLNGELSAKETHVIYGSADGTGSGSSRSEAIHRALSEALERWAFFQTHASSEAGRFGFDIDPTTTGMAAFPGLTFLAPRQTALNEAIERWSVCAWWEGNIGARAPIPVTTSISGIFLKTPWPKSPVVILSGSQGKVRTYGFACATSEKSAISKALIELDRNFDVLRDGASDPNSSLFEKRLLYFCTDSGQDAFEDKLSQSLAVNACPNPKLIVDHPIPGKWSQYASVWRCLFEPVSSAFLDSRHDYFLF